MNPRSVSIVIVAAITLATVSASGQERQDQADDLAARSQRLRLSGGVTPAEFDQTIRDTYQRLAKDSERSIEFEIHELRTLARDEFHQYTVFDVSTLPSGNLLKVTRQSPTGDPLRMHFDWIDVGAAHTLTPGGQEAVKWSIDEVLQKNSGVDPLLQHVAYLTTYRVRVEYQGRERRYRAMFLWLDDGQGRFAAAPLDHVVQGVEAVIRERWQPEGVPPKGPRRATSSDTTLACIPETTQDGRTSPLMKFTNGHLPASGGPSNHGYLFFADYECNCDSNCAQTCDVVDTFQQCNESGPTTTCHKISEPSTVISRGFSRPGMPPASCNFGIGCAWRECFACFCTPGITVSFSSEIVGASATLTPAFLSGNPMLDELPYYCPNCREDETACAGSSTTGAAVAASCTGDEGSGDGGQDSDPWVPTPSSPIVVDLDRGGFAFTSAAEGVRFDMAGDGAKEQLSWTEPDSGDGFVVLDRDANHRIDSGRELFGNYSWQFENDEPNGFLSLAVFDRPDQGGNGDGWMSAEDGNFRHLRVWIDSNHDGVSQPHELARLADVGIRSIGLDYVESRRRDRHGNEQRFSSKVVLEAGSTRAVDVFFLTDSTGDHGDD